MWLSLFRSLVLLAAPAAFAQEFISLSAERNWVLAGRSLSMQAVVEGEFGETLPDVPVSWASSNPAVARVGADGVVTGLMPGNAVIEASAGAAASVFTVWVHPARIEITPSRMELEVGGKAAFTARALDADGRALAVPDFVWTSGLSSIATVDSAGNVQAGEKTGTMTVTARLGIPQGHASFTAQAQVVIRPRQVYRFDRFASSDATSQVTIKAIQNLDYANDRFAFLAALSNGGQALMIFQSGLVRKLIATGEKNAAGGTILNIGNPSINPRGDVAALLSFTVGPPAMYFFPFDKPAEPYAEPELAGRCCMNGMGGALSDNGEFVFGEYSNGFDEIYIGRAGAQPVRVPTDNLPVVGRSQNMRYNPVRFAGPGRLVFSAWNGNRFGVFMWDGRQITKVVALGDSVLGRTVDWIDQQFSTASNGDVYLRFGGPQYHRIAKWSAGSWTPIVEGYQSYGGIALRDLNWVGHASGDAVIFDAASDRGNGLFKFSGGQLQRVVTWGAESEHPFRYSRQVFVRPDGDIVVAGPTAAAHSRVSRFTGGAESLMYESGRAAGFPAALPMNWNTLAASGAGGALIARAASGAIVRVGQDSLQVLLSPGDSLGNGALVDWIGSYGIAPNGDAAVQIGSTQGGQRLYVLRGQTRVEVHGPANKIQTQAGEEVIWFNNRVAINNRGQIAATVHIRASNGNEFERHVLIAESTRQARTVFTPGAAAPGGGTFNWIDQLQVDEQGRVWFVTGATSAGSSLFSWDNGTVTKHHTQGDAMPDGRRLRAFNDLQFVNGRVFFNSWFDNSPNAFIETAAGKLSYRISHLEPTSFGSQIGYYPNGGYFRAAPNGDVAYLAAINNQQTLIVRKPDGTDTVVARQFERIGGAAGPWADSFFDLAWDTAGRLFVTAATQDKTSRIDLFLAAPR